MAPRERYDTVVIGAGMSGLAAGIRLAQFGQRALIVEKHYLWGGLNSFYKLGGRRFDTGLHALTNYVPPGTRGKPLTTILRQLRLRHADLALREQSESAIQFPGVRLRFSNDFELLRQEIAEHFPAQRDGFARLLECTAEYPDPTAPLPRLSAREMLGSYLSDPLLVDMLLLPVCYYASPTDNDIDWTSYVLLFKSMFEEGFARPEGGVRTILDLLRGRYLDVGGELRMKCGVSRIHVRNGRFEGLELEDGTEVLADRLLSSAGYVETMRMCGDEVAAEHVQPGEIGEISFLETVSVLDTTNEALGNPTTVTFFNTEERAVYGKPEGPVDYRSGVICCPDNYEGHATEGVFRLTLPANFDIWSNLSDEEYYPLKDEVWERGLGVVSQFAPDVRAHTVFKDTFTPRTIERYTGHLNGAIYGSRIKRPSGETPIGNLYVCGTDQAGRGIVGALLSGIAMANRHALVPA